MTLIDRMSEVDELGGWPIHAALKKIEKLYFFKHRGKSINMWAGN